MPAVTIRLTGELRPGRGDGRRGAGSGFGRQRPSTPTVVSGWERLAAVRLRSAATAAPAVADAPSAPARTKSGRGRRSTRAPLSDPNPRGSVKGVGRLFGREDIGGGLQHHLVRQLTEDHEVPSRRWSRPWGSTWGQPPW